jgi:ABC-type phosphate/phosphonate transport system substrate-binding protein
VTGVSGVSGVTGGSGERGATRPSCDPWVGRLVGEKLRIVRPIAGRGGATGRAADGAPSARGALYEAENTQTLRRVEIRLLDAAELESRASVRRFVREARAGARLQHPNVVDVFDLGEDAASGALFVVQEALRGVSLEALLEEREQRDAVRLTPAECVAVLLPIAEALEAAHQLGLVHGELSIASIFLAQRGGLTVPKLVDFGLGARLEGAPSSVPSTPRDDVRALGALLSACLIASEPRGPDALPEELREITARAKAEPAAGGFESMTDLLRALRATETWARRDATAADPLILAGGVSSIPPPMPIAWPTFERLAWAPREPAQPASTPMTPMTPMTPRGGRALRKGRARFGLVLEGRGDVRRVAVKGISQAVRSDVAVIGFESYARLVDALAEGAVDLAWLPPVAYVRARRAGAARLLLTVEREGSRSYSSAILARSELAARTVRELHQLRAAWVGPWSAAGFLIPRRMLRGAGLEPETRFRTQTFVGSYQHVLRALVDDEADVGAAWCRLGASGELTHGAFLDDPRVRVLAVSHDPIPGDAICASPTLDLEAAREGASRFVRAASSPELVHCFRALLGNDRFVAANPSRYERLELALDEDLHPLAERALTAQPTTRAATSALRSTAAWEAVG